MADWVKQVLSNHVEEHDPGFEIEQAGSGGLVSHVRDDQPPEVQRIEEVLDRTVRPYLQGGRRRPGRAGLREQPRGCELRRRLRHLPSSVAGTLQAIQSVLRDEVNPEIEVVSADTG